MGRGRCKQEGWRGGERRREGRQSSATPTDKIESRSCSFVLNWPSLFTFMARCCRRHVSWCLFICFGFSCFRYWYLQVQLGILGLLLSTVFNDWLERRLKKTSSRSGDCLHEGCIGDVFWQLSYFADALFVSCSSGKLLSNPPALIVPLNADQPTIAFLIIIVNSESVVVVFC